MQHGKRVIAAAVVSTLVTGCLSDVGPSYKVKSPTGFMVMGGFLVLAGVLSTAAAIDPGEPPPGEEALEPGERLLLGGLGVVLTGLGVLAFHHGWTM